MVILDTCAIIEICKNKPAFKKKTLKLMNMGSAILSISFAEIVCKVKLGKLEMSVSPRALYNEFEKIQHIEIIDINPELWLDSIDLDWPDNKDPADRIIVAFASQENIPIVTCDVKIKKFYKNVMW